MPAWSPVWEITNISPRWKITPPAAGGARGHLLSCAASRGPLLFGKATLHVAGVDYQPLFQKARLPARLRGAW